MTSAQPRHWRSAADALAVLRQQQRVTRPELGRHLGLDTGPTSDLVKRLTRAGLVSEHWGVADMLSLMQQLGVVPAGPPA